MGNLDYYSEKFNTCSQTVSFHGRASVITSSPQVSTNGTSPPTQKRGLENHFTQGMASFPSEVANVRPDPQAHLLNKTPKVLVFAQDFTEIN